MSLAFRADPELIGCPRLAWTGVAHVHLGAASHAADLDATFVHAGDSSLSPVKSHGVVPAVVLAAGRSTRMGRPKALLPIGGVDTFVTRVVRTFLDAGVEDVVVVLGEEADAIAARLAREGLDARIVVNRAFATGQLSSVLKGLDAIDRPGVEAMLVTLVDVPLVGADTVRAVLRRFRETGAPIVRPVRGDDHGHPVLIARSLFAALRSGDPATGMKPIVRRHVSPAGDVVVEDEGAFLDIDTPEQYERAIGPLAGV